MSTQLDKRFNAKKGLTTKSLPQKGLSHELKETFKIKNLCTYSVRDDNLMFTNFFDKLDNKYINSLYEVLGCNNKVKEFKEPPFYIDNNTFKQLKPNKNHNRIDNIFKLYNIADSLFSSKEEPIFFVTSMRSHQVDYARDKKIR